MELDQFAVQTATVRCDPCGRGMTVVVETTLLDAIHQLCLPLGQACDGVACIPMATGVASVNVAVASAVFLYEWQRRYADPVRNEEDGA